MRSIAEVTKDIDEARSTNQDFESVVKPLYDEQRTIIRHNRDEYEDNNYFVMIDCPVHLSHKVKLFTHGHRYAGIWECVEDDGVSDSCPHYDAEIEVGYDDDSRLNRFYVCSLCRQELEGDPDEEQDE
jgi:hypothetical protein